MAEIHLSKWLISLAIREMQIKITLRYHVTSDRMTKIKNTNDSLCWRGCGVRGTFLRCWWECKLYNQFRYQYCSFSENRESTYLRIQQLGIYPKDAQSYYKDICSTMLIAALFVMARTWKQPRCLSTEEWLKKMWHIYTLEYYSELKTMAYWILHANC